MPPPPPGRGPPPPPPMGRPMPPDGARPGPPGRPGGPAGERRAPGGGGIGLPEAEVGGRPGGGGMGLPDVDTGGLGGAPGPDAAGACGGRGVVGRSRAAPTAPRQRPGAPGSRRRGRRSFLPAGRRPGGAGGGDDPLGRRRRCRRSRAVQPARRPEQALRSGWPQPVRASAWAGSAVDRGCSRALRPRARRPSWPASWRRPSWPASWSTALRAARRGSGLRARPCGGRGRPGARRCSRSGSSRRCRARRRDRGSPCS